MCSSAEERRYMPLLTPITPKSTRAMPACTPVSLSISALFKRVLLYVQAYNVWMIKSLVQTEAPAAWLLTLP